MNVTHLNRAWFESTLRVALGNNTQSVDISGSTAITEAGITDTFTGGLLAQRPILAAMSVTSSDDSRDRIQTGCAIDRSGIRDHRILRLVLSRTSYAPAIKSTRRESGLVPPEIVPLTGALRPRFRYIESDYLANGISLGGELRF